jgi:hypothetical protein
MGKRRFMDEYVRCPHCGGETPGETFNCIYCGEPIPYAAGVFTGLRYGARGMLCIAIAAVLIAALLAWLFI